MNDNAKIISELSRDQLELLRARLSRLTKKGRDDSLMPITRQSRDSNKFPLSFAQQRLWFIDQMVPGGFAYNIPTAVRLTGRLDADALERALNEIVRRHESLRTTFTTVDEQPVQVIAPSGSVPLHKIDLMGLPYAEREAEATRLTGEETRQPFDLSRGPLLRATLMRVDEQDHILVRTIHHVVSDKISQDILVRELIALYDAFSTGRPSPLQELPIQYADFAHWQREWLRGEVLESQLAYWKQKLAGAAPALNLPADRARPPVQTFNGARHSMQLPVELVADIELLSQREGCTPFMTLLAALKALIYLYTNQQDISIGTTISGRHRTEIESLIGFFVNTLVLRTEVPGDVSFSDLLGLVREVVLGAEAHQYVPFEKLVEELHVQRDPSRHPLFQVIFNLQTAPPSSFELPGLVLTPIEANNGTVKFDMAIFLARIPEGLFGSFFYNTDLFEASTIARMAEDYETLLRTVAARPGARLGELQEMLSQENQRKRALRLNELKRSNLQRLKAVRRKGAGE
ncbi:MAG TPA: condensation domain-containing protein [Blastocatellia bacterium]|nr:condensation domain-containing protein [Blastocatellia bacterium]